MHRLIYLNCRQDRVMNKKKMARVSDRELFSELFETPIHPMLIHVVPPFVNEDSPMFYIQINGDAIWKWREIYSRPGIVFDLLQQSILPLGYELMESSRDRVGNAVATSIRRFWQKIQDITDGNSRQRKKAETWIRVVVKPDEIQRTPDDIITELNKRCENVEEKAADLYDKMRLQLAHSGKEFQEVGKKQQNRHLSQIQ